MATIRAGSVKAGIELAEFWVDEPQEYSAAFAAMSAARVDALLIVPTPEMYRDVEQVSALALESRLPTICGFSEEKGCLIGYAPNFTELRQQTAEQVAKILQGANASELPFQGPTRFEFAINLKTARRLGLTLPPDLLLSADKVIE
jgi:putative ABC transport system substrate-binding protein